MVDVDTADTVLHVQGIRKRNAAVFFGVLAGGIEIRPRFGIVCFDDLCVIMKKHPLFANVLIPFFRFYCYSFPFYDDTDICAASRAQIIAIRAVLACVNGVLQ